MGEVCINWTLKRCSMLSCCTVGTVWGVALASAPQAGVGSSVLTPGRTVSTEPPRKQHRVAGAPQALRGPCDGCSTHGTTLPPSRGGSAGAETLHLPFFAFSCLHRPPQASQRKNAETNSDRLSRYESGKTRLWGKRTQNASQESPEEEGGWFHHASPGDPPPPQASVTCITESSRSLPELCLHLSPLPFLRRWSLATSATARGCSAWDSAAGVGVATSPAQHAAGQGRVLHECQG